MPVNDENLAKPNPSSSSLYANSNSAKRHQSSPHHHPQRALAIDDERQPLKESQSLQKIPKVMGGGQQSNSNDTNGGLSTSSLNRVKKTRGGNGSSIQCAIMKTSQSMTSLPPPPGFAAPNGNGSKLILMADGENNSNDMIHARLRIERPYNSLKKKRDSERELWRRSWESHSSYSLYGGSSNGKDDFWAALQPNYNYIMDTNLIDSCREAHGEIVEFLSSQEQEDRSCTPEQSASHSHAASPGSGDFDPRRLRRWLREMENCMAQSPTLSLALKLTLGELKKAYDEHTELYCKIVSKARVVGACIRSAEKELKDAQEVRASSSLESATTTVDEQQLNSISSTSSHNPSTTRPSGGRSGSNLKGLENRYHLLYLKAFEIQCMLESLLNKKEAQTPNSASSSKSASDTDEEPALKQRRLCSVGELSFNFGTHLGEGTIFQFCGQTKSSDRTHLTRQQYCPDKKDDDVNYVCDLFNGSQNKIVDLKSNISIRKESATGSDADSEGSDCERDNKIQSIVIDHPRPLSKISSVPVVASTSETVQALPIKEETSNVEGNFDQMDGTALMIGSAIVMQSTKNMLPEEQPMNEDLQQILTPARSSPQKRHRPVDASKFNRSNRKSKNCATFYFKHLDTDGENQKNGFSSQNDEDEEEGQSDGLIKLNGESTSEEDEWVYTDNVTNGHSDQSRIMSNGDGTVIEVNCNKSSHNGEDSQYKHVVEYCSKESIQQLVLNAENLVREEVLLKRPAVVITNGSSNYVGIGGEQQQLSTSAIKSGKVDSYDRPILATAAVLADDFMGMIMRPTSSTPKKGSGSNADKRKSDSLKIKLVQEWLEQQPLENSIPVFSTQTTDCEASGEYTTESDCAQHSDSSEGITDSVATCLQGDRTSQGTSTEIINGSVEPLMRPRRTQSNDDELDGITPIQHSKVTLRNKRRNSDRPWSVSSLSQLQRNLNTSAAIVGSNNQLANFSISESALHTLSPHSPSTRSPKTHHSVKTLDSRGSLKKRKYRIKRRSIGKRSDSGSEEVHPQRDISRILLKSESFCGPVENVMSASMTTSGTMTRKSSITNSSGSINKLSQGGTKRLAMANNVNITGVECEEEIPLPTPSFKLGSLTNVYGGNHQHGLGVLASLSNYNGGLIAIEGGDIPLDEEEAERIMNSNNTPTEDLSSEQAWDNYQEKYNSENYSEGLDTDAAKRLLEFGDDYRNFMDSQSDCCSSSLSAANNLDSLSPPRHRKFPESAGRAQVANQLVTPTCDNNCTMNNNTVRRRRALEFAEYERRRKNSDSSKKRLDDRRKSTESSQSFKYSPKHGSDGSRKKSLPARLPADSSSEALSSEGHDESEEDDLQIQNLLLQSRSDLEKTQALRVRTHLLRPEDYAEIISTCQEQIQGLGTMVNGPTVMVLSAKRCNDMRELLSSWEDLLKWSESASEARQLQEEMSQLKVVLRSYASQYHVLDSKASITSICEKLQEEKVKLKSHRLAMLKLNSRVHSWVTRQESQLKSVADQQKVQQVIVSDGAGAIVGSGTLTVVSANQSTKSTSCIMDAQVEYDDSVLHVQLKDDVSDMYKCWDEAQGRINDQLDLLANALQTWTQLEIELGEFTETLGKYRTLYELKDVLDRGDVQLPNDGVIDVRQVSKLLSERIEANNQHKMHEASSVQTLHPSSAILYSLKSSSNGSLSDSGISDGGCGSDGGLSERERRLGSLRRQAKQLENSLAPGSAALKSIYQRMEAAEAELKRLQNLQETCREAVERLVRTSSPSAAANKLTIASKEDDSVSENGAGLEKINGEIQKSMANSHPVNSDSDGSKKSSKSKRSPQSKRKNKNKRHSVENEPKQFDSISTPPPSSPVLPKIRNENVVVSEENVPDLDLVLLKNLQEIHNDLHGSNGVGVLVKRRTVGDGGYDNDPQDIVHVDNGGDDDDDDGNGEKKSWAWRVARIAIPLQFALVSLFCMACLFEPQCCDVINNFSMSFTPQLRYVRGPPPV